MRDPFTLSVIQAGFENAAEEMFAVLRRTAMSSIIHEVLDVGTRITDAQGCLVSSGVGIPTFVGVLDKTVKVIVGRNSDSLHRALGRYWWQPSPQSPLLDQNRRDSGYDVGWCA